MPASSGGWGGRVGMCDGHHLHRMALQGAEIEIDALLRDQRAGQRHDEQVRDAEQQIAEVRPDGAQLRVFLRIPGKLQVQRALGRGVEQLVGGVKYQIQQNHAANKYQHPDDASDQIVTSAGTHNIRLLTAILSRTVTTTKASLWIKDAGRSMRRPSSCESGSERSRTAARRRPMPRQTARLPRKRQRVLSPYVHPAR